jgi:hypothetical protein
MTAKVFNNLSDDIGSSAHLSKRYKIEVSKLINNLSLVNTNKEYNDIMYSVLKVLDTFCYIKFCGTQFIRGEYPNLLPTSKKFFGGFDSLLIKLKYCNDTNKLGVLITRRINYVMDKLNQALYNNLFSETNEDLQYEAQYIENFCNIILSLYEKYGFTNFQNLRLCNFNLSNYTFTNCTFNGAAFDYSNLSNTNFINCDLRGSKFNIANVNGAYIDENCRVSCDTSFHSKATLLDTTILQDISKLTFDIHCDNWQVNKLINFKKNIKESQLASDDEMLIQFAKYLLDTEKVKELKLSDTLIIDLVCPITFNSSLVDSKAALVDFKNICAIKYNNIIRLYDFKALWEYLKIQFKCPFRVSLESLNLLTIKDIKQEIINAKP